MRITTKQLINNRRILRQVYKELAEMGKDLTQAEVEKWTNLNDQVRQYRGVIESLPSPATYEQEMAVLEKIDELKAVFQS